MQSHVFLQKGFVSPSNFQEQTNSLLPSKHLVVAGISKSPFIYFHSASLSLQLRHWLYQLFWKYIRF